MNLFKKTRHPDGRRSLHFCGIKLFSYVRRKHVRQTGMAVVRDYGGGNTVHLADPKNPNVHISITGSGNTVEIEAANDFAATIYIGVADCPANNCRVKIGPGTTSCGMTMMLLESDSSVSIGNDCMFSNDVELHASDTHSLLDLDGRLLNFGRQIEIGDHMWVGKHARILKNTRIPDNSVVGMCSLVTGSFDEPNCVLAGVPAKVVRRDVAWSRTRPQQHVDNAHGEREGDYRR